MASKSDIIMHIGAQMDKNYAKEMNEIEKVTKQTATNIGKSFEKINSESAKLKKAQENTADLQKQLEKTTSVTGFERFVGTPTTQTWEANVVKYAEKLRAANMEVANLTDKVQKLSETNLEGKNWEIFLNTSKIDRAKDKIANLIAKAKPEERIGVEDIVVELNAELETTKALTEERKKLTNELESYNKLIKSGKGFANVEDAQIRAAQAAYNEALQKEKDLAILKKKLIAQEERDRIAVETKLAKVQETIAVRKKAGKSYETQIAQRNILQQQIDTGAIPQSAKYVELKKQYEELSKYRNDIKGAKQELDNLVNTKVDTLTKYFTDLSAEIQRSTDRTNELNKAIQAKPVSMTSETGVKIREQEAVISGENEKALKRYLNTYEHLDNEYTKSVKSLYTATQSQRNYSEILDVNERKIKEWEQSTREALEKSIQDETSHEEAIKQLKENTVQLEQEAEQKKSAIREKYAKEKDRLLQEEQTKITQLEEKQAQAEARAEERAAEKQAREEARAANKAEAEALREQTAQTKALKNAVKGVASAFGTVAKAVKSVGTAVAKHIGNSLGVIGKTIDSTFQLSKMVSLVVQYGFGFRSLYYLVRRFRSGIQQGFEYLGGAIKSSRKTISGFSEEMRELLDTIKELFFYLKSAAAAMLQPFMPLVSSIIPKLVAWFNTLSRTVATFVATLTGQKFIYTATTDLDAYANALDQANSSASNLAKTLGAYDKLNVIKQDTGGSGATNLDTSGWFTEEEIQPSSLAEMIRKAWEDADFTQVGIVIGEKLRDTLANIQWESVFEKVTNIGKSIGTFINGAISVEDLAQDIGETIANALNLVTTFIGTLSDTIDWTSLGQFIAEGLGGFFETFDANQLGSAIHSFFSGILDTLVTITDDPTVWAGLGESIGNFFSGLQIDDLSGKLLNLAKNIAQGIATALNEWAKTDPESFGITTALLTAIGALNLTIVGVALTEQLASFLKSLEVLKGVNILASLAPIGEFLSGLASNGILETIGNALFAIVQTFGEGAALAGGLIAILVTGFIAAYDASEDFRTQVHETLSSLWNLLISIWENVLVPLFDFVKAVIGPILSELWKQLGNIFAQVLSPILNILKVLFDVMSTQVFPIIKDLFEILKAVWNFISPVLTLLIAIIGELLSTIISAVGGIINIVVTAVQAILNALGGVIQFITGNLATALTTLSSKWKTVWEGIKNTTRTMANSLIGFFNRLLSGFANMINGVVRGLNKLHWDAPGWLTKWTGIESFGFNLSEVSVPQIPYLAQGAVIPPNKEFLAVLGDQSNGTNIEAPLDTIKQAVAEVLATMGASTHEDIVLKLNSKEMARAVWDENQKRYKQTGKYAF